MARIPRPARLAFVVIVFALSVGLTFALERSPARNRAIMFVDAPSQAAEFIGYSRSIRLTASQREIWEAALASMPSPCCKDFSLSTCCCPCNLAKSCWGLANFLIARRGATVQQVRDGVAGWLAFVNPSGFGGDVCVSSGGCARPFSKNGCGGMDERSVVAAR